MYNKEEYNMYNDELDYALESAYEDGYYQALADMGYEFDDAEEDVDIFDEDCFDDAVEGRAVYSYIGTPINNKAKRQKYDRLHGTDMATQAGRDASYDDAKRISRSNAKLGSAYQRNIGRRNMERQSRRSRYLDLQYDRTFQPGNTNNSINMSEY
jgi:hypothetical protein